MKMLITFEDVEFSYRAKLTGYDLVFQPEAIGVIMNTR